MGSGARESNYDAQVVVVHSDEAIEGVAERDFIAVKSRDLTEQLARSIPLSDVKPDDFEIDGCIGVGGYGCVLSSILKSTRERFAMKAQKGIALRMPFALDALKTKSRKRVETEQRLSLACNLKFIAKATYVFEDKKHFYIASEIARYGDLVNAFNADFTPVTIDQARFIIAQCVLAIEYLHCAEIVHRDIKPRNILMCADGYVKLTDFGCCSELKRGRSYTFVGTPGYIAPEIFFSSHHGKSVDWFSLGRTTRTILIEEASAAGDNLLAELAEAPIDPDKVVFETRVTPVAQDFIKQLSVTNPSVRLGVKAGGSRDVRKHAWFDGLDWLALYAKRYPNPFAGLRELQVRGNWLEDTAIPDPIKVAFGYQPA